jgi:hypothetical protein
MKTLNRLHEKNLQLIAKANAESSVNITANATSSVEPKVNKKLLNEEDIGLMRHNLRLQSDIYECLQSIYSNQIVFNMLGNDTRAHVSYFLDHFCPITNRFYKTDDDIKNVRIFEYGFDPAAPSLVKHNNNTFSGLKFSNEMMTSSMERLNSLLINLLPNLLPPSSLVQDRQVICERIEKELIKNEALPSGTKLLVYGSSSNTFGTVDADLDMCISFPSHITIHSENKPKILELIGKVLSSLGMIDVEVRSTARVPIVSFRDHVSGCIIFYDTTVESVFLKIS